MNTLADIRPFVGDSMKYVYDGSSNEKLRVGSTYAVHLFTNGPGEMEVEGRRYPIRRGTLIFLKPGQPHAFHVSKDTPLSSYNLYFDLWPGAQPAAPSRYFVRAPLPLELGRRSLELPCEELDKLPAVSSLNAYPHLHEGLVRIHRLFDELHAYRQQAIDAYFYAWMLEWHNVMSDLRPGDYRILRLLKQLHDHPEQRVSVAEWAQSCGMKRTYFHECFLRETGLTPKAYQHRLLMKKAARLLLESSLSVTAVAEKLGYDSIHPFTRHFGAYYGTSPSRFRGSRMSNPD